METLDIDFWKTAFEHLSKTFQAEHQYLCRLDGAIGDGDHGTSMVLGWKEVEHVIQPMQFKDVGSLLRKAGNVFITSVGGVTGVLFGTLLMAAGGAVEGKQETGAAELAAMFRQSVEAVKTRGKAAVGDKTMLDALVPAAEALEEAAAKSVTTKEALIAAAEAAQAGMEATREMEAKAGRARYQGVNSVGHIDAGAASIALFFKVLSQV